MSLLVAPCEALTDALLSDPERRVLLALFSFRGRVTELVFPSLEALAQRSLIKDKTRVSKITTSLSKKGWLVKKKKGFTGCNQYKMCLPERLISTDCETKLDSDTKLGPHTKSNLDCETKSNLDSDAKYKEHTNRTNQYNTPIPPNPQGGRKTETRVVKSDSFKAVFAMYPSHRKGGTDAQAWKAWKSEKLTDHDAGLACHWLTHASTADPNNWSITANGFAYGITKFIRERMWLTPVPTAKTGNADMGWDDITWADNLEEVL